MKWTTTIMMGVIMCLAVSAENGHNYDWVSLILNSTKMQNMNLSGNLHVSGNVILDNLNINGTDINSYNQSIDLSNYALISQLGGGLFIYSNANITEYLGSNDSLIRSGNLSSVVRTGDAFNFANFTLRYDARTDRYGNPNFTANNVGAFNGGNFTSVYDAITSRFLNANWTALYDNREERFGNGNFTTRYDLRTDRFANLNFSTLYDAVTSRFGNMNFTTIYDARTDRWGVTNFTAQVPQCTGNDKLTSADGNTITCATDQTGGAVASTKLCQLSNYDIQISEEFIGDTTADYKNIALIGTPTIQTAAILPYDYYGAVNVITAATANAVAGISHGGVTVTTAVAGAGINFTNGLCLDGAIQPQRAAATLGNSNLSFMYCWGIFNTGTTQRVDTISGGAAICSNATNVGTTLSGKINEVVAYQTYFQRAGGQPIWKNLSTPALPQTWEVTTNMTNFTLVGTSTRLDYYINGTIVTSIVYANVGGAPSKAVFVGGMIVNKDLTIVNVREFYQDFGYNMRRG